MDCEWWWEHSTCFFSFQLPFSIHKSSSVSCFQMHPINSEFTRLYSKKTTYKWAYHTVHASETLRKENENTANKTIQNQTKQQQQKEFMIFFFFSPLLMTKCILCLDMGWWPSQHMPSHKLKTESEERRGRWFENITQAACQTCVNPSGKT